MADIEEMYGTDVLHKKDFTVTDGDLNTISGLENMREHIFRRLITTKGSIVHRPDYGIGIKSFQNAPMSLPLKRQMAILIKEELEKDDRIDEVSSVSIDADDLTPETVTLKVTVKLTGYGEEEFIYTPFGDEASL